MATVEPRELDRELQREQVLLREVESGQRLDPVQPLAQGVDVHGQLACRRGQAAAVLEVALERQQQLGAALGVVDGEPVDRLAQRVPRAAVAQRPDEVAVRAHLPVEEDPAVARAGAGRRTPRRPPRPALRRCRPRRWPDVLSAERDAVLARERRQQPGQRAGVGAGDERADPPPVGVADRPRDGLAQRALQPGVGAVGERGQTQRARLQDEVRAVEVGTELARPRVGDLDAALLERGEQVAGDALLRQALDELGLLQRHGDLMRDRPQQLVAVVVPGLLGADHERPEQLRAGRDRHRERAAGDAPQPQGLRGRAVQHLQQDLGGLAAGGVAVVRWVGRDHDQPPRGVQLQEPAVVAGQQLAYARGGDAVEVGTARDGRDALAQRGQPDEVGDALLGLLVELGVLDRAGDHRRRLGQHVEDPLVELVRRGGVQDDDAEHAAAARRDRDRRHRLEAVLLELGDEVRTRVVHRALADERRLAVADRPPRQPLVHAELDATDLARVDGRRRPQAQPVARDEVHERGVRAGDAREQVDDAAEDVVEIR